MSNDASFWTRVKRFFRPERETYDTRKARPGDDGREGSVAEQYGRSTDQRRHGGTGATGAMS
jgi:hypothetical protein